MSLEEHGVWWHRVAQGLALNDLETLTRAYWDRLHPAPNATTVQRINWYIHHLLPEELEYADQQRSAVHRHPCDTLVLLVGHSPEPLLQTIGVFQPTRVVFVLNRQYGEQPGEERGAWMQTWTEQHLAAMLDSSPKAVDVYLTSDQPDAVFDTLCENVLRDRDAALSVIVDITGAKNSMAAGAFLFAAYADIPISYVDFDHYDPVYRRPPGYACRIGTLTNPYDAFRLRLWEQVRRHYENYRFKAAAEDLSDILAYMGRPHTLHIQGTRILSSQTLAAAKKLLPILHLYAAWDDGDYAAARQLLTAVAEHVPDFMPPAAVELLGKVWPHADVNAEPETAARNILTQHEALRTGRNSIFASNLLLMAYAQDELAKIGRLVETNEDNRSALLRAAGLDELLLKARLVRLWHAGQLMLCDRSEHRIGRNTTLDATEQRRLFDKLVQHQGTDYMRRTLQKHERRDRSGRRFRAFIGLDGDHVFYRIRPTSDALKLSDYDQDAGMQGETLTHLRNQAIHMYLYVTRPIAQAAVAVARANLAEFESVWAGTYGPAPRIVPEDVRHLPWNRLCQLCGLDMLPLRVDDKMKG